jgi:hypothetical protein
MSSEWFGTCEKLIQNESDICTATATNLKACHTHLEKTIEK